MAATQDRNKIIQLQAASFAQYIYACAIKSALICAAVLAVSEVPAQPNHGAYYYHYYSPKDYKSPDFGSSPQNWGVAQDHRGLMYFCNTSGILEYDGVTWRMVTGTENLEMLKAVCGADGRIYTGGIGEFGYLGADADAGIRFQSLTHLLPDTFPDFQRIFAVKSVGDSIAFLSSKHLFIYHDGALTTHSTANSYRRILTWNDRLIVQLGNLGMYEVAGGELVELLEPGTLQRNVVKHVFGAGKDPMLATYRDGLFRIEEGKLQPIPTLLDTMTVWNADRLPGKISAIGTSESGAVIIDETGQVQGVFYEEYDLVGDVVISPYFDRSGQLWLATTNGIGHIEFPSQVSYFSEAAGWRGIPLSLHESGEGLMIGTTVGLYLQDPATGRFERHHIEEDQAEEFVTDIINVAGDQLILTSHGLFRKGAGTFDRITAIGGFDLKVMDPAAPAVVYGGEGGVVTLRRSGNQWKVDHVVDTVGHDILSVSPVGEHTIWASMFSISRIDLSDHGATVTTLDSTQGFMPEMGPAWCFAYDGKAYFCTASGLYSWNEDVERLVPDTLLGERFAEGALSNATVLGDSAVWLYHDGAVGRVDLASRTFEDQDLRRLDFSDVWNIFPTDDGHVWILTTEAVVRYDPAVDNTYQEGFNAVVRSVTTGADSTLFNGFFSSADGVPTLVQSAAMQPSLDYRYNQVSFHYAATYYSAPDQITYSIMLEGQDAGWSPWSAQTFKEYMNLREGQYTFRVKARNIYGVESAEASYAFTIQPPWHRTGWAYLLYTVLVGLAVWGIAVLYSLRLRQQKVRLEGIVKDRTREIAEEKQKSDNLLLNILPAETARELKTQGFATARSYEQVSVLFADFVSFTAISEKMTPEELVREIDVCFSAFDEIVEREGIEKIKTIGDAYMCAAGLNPALGDPEVRIVRTGIAMREFMREHNARRAQQGLPYFELRIGVHTGPIIAGVVGKKKFAYDIWGDTVNTAARMESSSEPGSINISATTYRFVKDEFDCVHRGKVQAKDKGELEMYYVRDAVKV